jgi:hypothetical protein
MPHPHITDVDMTKVTFGPVKNNGKQVVELKHSKGELFFNLCTDPHDPLTCRYRLDRVRDDQDGSRRGLVVNVGGDVLKSLKALDEIVVQAAFKHSKEWFKKELSEEEVRLRYKPLVGDEPHIKFKVKCPPGKNPTKLHRLYDDGSVLAHGGKVEHLERPGAAVAPILNVYSLWFMANAFGLVIQADEMIVKPGVAPGPLSDFCFAGKRPFDVMAQP